MKKKILYILGFVVVLMSSASVKAQQDSQFTQYMYNTLSFNPAYAGSRGGLSAIAAYRNQWLGVDGAPETLSFSAHTPINLERLAVGIGFTNDKIGPSSESTATADVSYTIPLDMYDLKLSFGVKAGLNILDIDMNKLNIYDPNDVNLVNKTLTSPVVGVGLYLHTSKWYIGLSTPNMLNSEHYDEVKVSTASEKMHMFLTAGYVFDLSPSFKFKPAMQTKAVVGAPLSVDISANFLYNDRITLGAAYRWDAAVSVLTGFQVNRNIMIGYSYDYDITDFSNYNDGSHDIFIRFELGNGLKNKVNPRFF